MARGDPPRRRRAPRRKPRASGFFSASRASRASSSSPRTPRASSSRRSSSDSRPLYASERLRRFASAAGRRARLLELGAGRLELLLRGGASPPRAPPRAPRIPRPGSRPPRSRSPPPSPRRRETGSLLARRPSGARVAVPLGGGGGGGSVALLSAACLAAASCSASAALRALCSASSASRDRSRLFSRAACAPRFPRPRLALGGVRFALDRLRARVGRNDPRFTSASNAVANVASARSYTPESESLSAAPRPEASPPTAPPSRAPERPIALSGFASVGGSRRPETRGSRASFPIFKESVEAHGVVTTSNTARASNPHVRVVVLADEAAPEQDGREPRDVR